MEDLDICILINNAGILYNGYFRDIDINHIKEMTVVNTYPYVFLTKVLLDQLMARAKNKTRSAIINLSSLASTTASPFQAVYGATKVFER